MHVRKEPYVTFGTLKREKFGNSINREHSASPFLAAANYRVPSRTQTLDSRKVSDFNVAMKFGS